jgi:hypothetical protein
VIDKRTLQQMEVHLSDQAKHPRPAANAEKATDPAKKDQALTNDELDKVSAGKGPAPVKLPFDIEQ